MYGRIADGTVAGPLCGPYIAEGQSDRVTLSLSCAALRSAPHPSPLPWLQGRGKNNGHNGQPLCKWPM